MKFSLSIILFARHGRALTGASPEHAQVVGVEYVLCCKDDNICRNQLDQRVHRNAGTEKEYTFLGLQMVGRMD